MGQLAAGRAPFIVFEGIDGSGKSTQVKRLRNRLRDREIEHYVTEEPTDSPIGGLIRQIMTGRVKTDNRVIAMLFAADRLDHILNEKNGLLEKLNRGTLVISDRYYLSSYAYHAVDMPMEWVVEANAPSRELLQPDIHLFIDTDLEEVLHRIARRSGQQELFEKESRLRRVRQKYLDAIAMLDGQENVVILDGNRPAEVIEQEVWEYVGPLLAE
ncbi:MAG: dTMP kinase [Lachnospiraceae bacterium]|nr:dTMP kinase [Lachnospiraceae bacterium]